MSTLTSIQKCILGFALSLAVVNAQMDTGTILGVVRDTSGGLVANATVTLTNEGTGAVRTVTTTDSGQYTFSPLPHRHLLRGGGGHRAFKRRRRPAWC